MGQDMRACDNAPTGSNDPQPKIIVLDRDQRALFFEAAEFEEQAPPDHHRGCADPIMRPEVVEGEFGGRALDPVVVEAMHQTDIGRLRVGHLHFGLLREPPIVGVEKRQPITGRLGGTKVPCARRAAIGFANDIDRGAEPLCHFGGVVLGTIIHDEDFMNGGCLAEGALDRAHQLLAHIIGWDYDTDFRMHQ